MTKLKPVLKENIVFIEYNTLQNNIGLYSLIL